MRHLGLSISLLLVVVNIGCSNSAGPPLAPVNPPDQVTSTVTSNTEVAGDRAVWGFWHVRINNDPPGVVITPNRIAALHFNCVRLLEIEPCSTCLTIENIQWLQDNIVQAGFRLQHPYPGLVKMTGFDVRGIFISEGDHLFPKSNRLVALGTEVPRLLNPDGYTSLFNPTEFPEGSAPFPALAYLTGKYAHSGDLSATLNPYIAYGVDNPRRLFEAGSAETQTVQVSYPDLPFEFGYAVDASWLLVDEVVDPVTDFPPEANAIEAYKIVVQAGDPIELSGSEPEEIFIEVFDHQGLETISSVTVESPDLFDEEVLLEYAIQTSDESWLFNGFISNEKWAGDGEYPILVRVEDTTVDANLGKVDAYQIGNVQVTDSADHGWVRTWGGPEGDSSAEIDIDSEGNLYVCGNYSNNGFIDGHLRKYTPDGIFLWEVTWGGSGLDFCSDVCIDKMDNVYVTGHFQGTVDFDPGQGEDFHTTDANFGAYLSKFDVDGNFQWALTWGGGESYGVIDDIDGNLFLGGSFYGTVDFDPGPGEMLLTASGGNDSYLTKFNGNGEHIWALRWGNNSSGLSDNVWNLNLNSSGELYCTGKFRGTVDFDPGSGVDNHTANMHKDAFVSKFDLEGNYIWARTWGGSGYERAKGVAVDEIGNVYVTGRFPGSNIDFDPGPGTDIHSTNGGLDIFLSKFNSAGDHQWAHTWGGSGDEQEDGWCVNVDDNLYVYATGKFGGTEVEFDPGPGTDLRTSNGGLDIYLCKFDQNGTYLMGRAWGNSGDDLGSGAFIDGSENIYMCGYYEEIVNFGPSYPPCYGPEDYHSSYGSSDSFLIKFLPDGCW